MMTPHVLIQLSAAFIGGIGFALSMKIKGNQVFWAGCGAFLSWLVYLVSYSNIESYFFSNFIASIFVAVYAECMARINKTPTTIFLTASAIPLIPGRNLYFLMLGIVTGDNSMAYINGVTAGVIALAISLGFVLIAVLNRYVSRMQKFYRTKKHM